MIIIIFDYLYNISINNNEIEKLKLQNSNWHYNQILSKFNIKYPIRNEGKEVSNFEGRKNFRKRLKIINQMIIIDYAF